MEKENNNNDNNNNNNNNNDNNNNDNNNNIDTKFNLNELNNIKIKHNVILLVSKWCAECIPADRVWRTLAEERKDFTYKLIDVADPEGRRLSIDLYIRSVPSTIIDGKLSYVGIPTKEDAGELLF